MRRNWSRIFALVMGLSLLLAILAACGAGTTTGTTPAKGSTTIEVATDLPVSGKDESGGKPTENGAHLAVDQANANKTIPGYTLAFVPRDDVGPSGAHDPAVGKANVTALIGDALVAGVVGPLNSGVAEAEMPLANQAPLALISPANSLACLTKSDPNLCGGSKNLISTLRPSGKVTYFRVPTTDDVQGAVGAQLLYTTLHYKTAWLIDDAEIYGIGLADAFAYNWQKLGGKLLGRSSEPGTTTDFTGVLTTIGNSHPDVVYFAGTDATGGTLVRKQMLSVPTLKNTPFGGGDGIVTPDFAKTIGTSGGPVYGTTGSIDFTKTSSAQTYISQYKAAYNGEPTAYSLNAYDGMNILIQAIKKAINSGVSTPTGKSDAAGAAKFRQAVIDAIKQTDWMGVTGHITFDANGDTTLQVVSEFQLANVNGATDWKFLASVKPSA